MSRRSLCNLEWHLLRPTELRAGLCLLLVVACVTIFAARQASASNSGDAPAWMHALVNAPLPEHDEKTDAVLLYSEDNITVQSVDRIHKQVRVAYKILRPGGRDLGNLVIPYRSDSKVLSLRAWSIPAQGKDFEVRDKDAADVAIPAVPGSELITDVRAKFVRIPAADPGNVIGWEYELENRPLVLQDAWYFQNAYPAREEHYSLQLPAGWEYKASWLNHAEAAAQPSGSNQWQWVVNSVPAIKSEEEMPPQSGIEGQMIVSFLAPGGGRTFASWRDMGVWYNDLTRGRRDASSDINQRTTALTSSSKLVLAKMRSIADFIQRDIRYVGIELGIGGFQPHPATDVFAHRYGDCKDKVTLMSSMLKSVGVDSYYVLINTERGSVAPEMPAHVGGFDHAILAIKLPDGLSDGALVAVTQHPKLGRLLFFDPTDELTPFGSLRGALQANYGLLVTEDGGELLELPQLADATTGIRRSAKLKLTAAGTLSGDFVEVRVGDSAARERYLLKSVTKDADRIKPVENVLSNSLPTYHITHASLLNLDRIELPFQFDYSVVADNYAQSTGGLLIVRMRVVGNESSGLLETKEARKYPVVFYGPRRDSDTVEIAMPPGYEVEDLPEPVSVDYGFASYHSKTEVAGNALQYSRTLEIREPSVPLSKVNDLKTLYRVIAADERNTAVLRPAGKQ
ncbi:MAG TPA: DUF3857 and transglutaminase domain-containing protein [Candidatus Acidoferrum sp.]